MGEKEAKPAKKSGCLGRLVTLVVLLGLAGVGAGVAFIFMPQDVSDIAGTAPADAGMEVRDLRQVMKNALDGGYELTLREDEINRYISRHLKGMQGGALGAQASIRDVMVRLEEGRAEVVVVRDLMGRPFTLSMYLRVEQFEQPDGRISTQIFRNGGPYRPEVPAPLVGGRFGRVPVPEGFLLFVLPEFEKIAKVFRSPGGDMPAAMRPKPEKEIDFIEEMARIRIEDGKLVLNPDASSPLVPGR